MNKKYLITVFLLSIILLVGCSKKTYKHLPGKDDYKKIKEAEIAFINFSKGEN